MEIDVLFDQALTSCDRVGELRKIAQRLLDEGIHSDAVLHEFEQVRRMLRAADREEDEDAVMDVMDFLMGWCSPHLRLEVKPKAMLYEHESTLKDSSLDHPTPPAEDRTGNRQA